MNHHSTPSIVTMRAKSACADAFVVGARVRRADADEPGKIPAYQALIGDVVGVGADGRVRVWWDCDRACGQGAEPGSRDPATLKAGA